MLALQDSLENSDDGKLTSITPIERNLFVNTGESQKEALQSYIVYSQKIDEHIHPQEKTKTSQ